MVGAALIVGAVIGVLLGLLGGGGSILAVPALVYVLGLGVEEAVTMSLIVVGTAAVAGALPKLAARQVQWHLAGIFAAAGVPATIAGSAIARHLPQPAIMAGFAAVMVAAGVRMLMDRAEVGTACAVGDSGIDWRRCASRSIPAGLLTGLLTGVFGVGGGFLIIPALVMLLGVEMTIAVGTSLLIIAANSAAGVVAHLGGTPINGLLTAAFVGAAVTAALGAGHVGVRVNTDRLQRWFGCLVLAVAAYVLIDTIALR